MLEDYDVTSTNTQTPHVPLANPDKLAIAFERRPHEDVYEPAILLPN